MTTAEHYRSRIDQRVNNIMATITKTTETALTHKRNKASTNPFLPVITEFNDGIVRVITLDGDDKASRLMQQLRKAADSIGQAVSFALVDATSAKDAKAFKFIIRPKVVKSDTHTVTEGATENSAPLTPETPATPAKGKK